ncbi:MAG: signal peptidase I [Planctomycetaceae bacterium]
MSRRISHDDPFDQRWLRSAIDLAICFVMAVIMLREFVLEGYLISTGSMAPGLLGFHRRVSCPECQYEFAFGVSFDDSASSNAASIQEPEGAQRYATCPNCGQINIDVSGVPNSHGDQLLVQKHVYDLHPPKRWETIVFRNPASPGEAYVKRVVGLPGDRIRIINGDVYINGRIARKDFRQQQWMRIPVSTLSHLAHSEDWQMPWELDDGWKANGAKLQLDAATDMQWLRFRNWRWYGGHHVAETPLDAATGGKDWDSYVARFDSLSVAWSSRIDYDRSREVLRCEGVMPEDLQKDMIAHATTDEFRDAVYRLAALSHLAPVTDRYGYNAMVSSPEYVVGDLMLKTEFSWKQTPDEIRVQVPVEAFTFELHLKPDEDGSTSAGSWNATLLSLDDHSIVRKGRFLLPELRDGPASLVLEVSNFDRQVIVGINGEQCFEPLGVGTEMTTEQALEASVATIAGQKMDAEKAAKISLRWEQQKRWALGVTGNEVQIQSLEMFRDVFYTPARRRNAVESEYIVPDQAYFVQGDNSPVSSDSRNWRHPCVPHKMLIGKPFLVHLPSRPAVLQFGGRQWPIRVPEISRIRYIR